MIAQHLTSGCSRDANWDRGSGTASIEDEKSLEDETCAAIPQTRRIGVCGRAGEAIKCRYDDVYQSILDVVLRDALDVGTRATPASKLAFVCRQGYSNGRRHPPGPPRHATVQCMVGLSLPPDGLSADCHTPGVQTDVHYARYPTILSPGHGDIPLIRSASALGCKLSLKVVGSDQTSNMDVSTQLYGVQKARPHMRTRSR
ncbi:hypothetical protein COCSADRAFT_349254 [Bipolaris sorokiniana ND90Pr]|uniref:Uncharacterized protein n=1 Tax=Cochliobolus sativus (strain ND90Pr / ATCC 201652) TaxID=665912 RepID=M2T0A1_COCSN|nr:uncharacterized protein COCSADRAFT_349254 [Bipolaris sorokiniana ND90Pr]EMD67990.1 hypothetical protein COCSADRAFT_349254 [Bipolaris sorokiniana ND90Pr]